MATLDTMLSGILKERDELRKQVEQLKRDIEALETALLRYEEQELCNMIKEARVRDLEEVAEAARRYLEVKKTWDNRLKELQDLKRALARLKRTRPLCNLTDYNQLIGGDDE